MNKNLSKKYVNAEQSPIPNLKRFSHQAMAAIFDIFIIHDDAEYAEQAARTAFDELDGLEQDFSRFIENSDISQINNLSANQTLVIGPTTFKCLQLCKNISKQTNGAFDITIGSLFKLWKKKDEPSQQQINTALKKTGLNLIKLDEKNHTVKVLTDSIQLDFGGVGKGYAADQMAKILHEWEIDTALVSAGSSTILAIGAPKNKKGWPVTVSNPDNRKEVLAYLHLKNRAIAGSGLEKGRHIIDPRNGKPVKDTIAAWSSAGDAASADALSTAFMVMLPQEVKSYCQKTPSAGAMILPRQTNKAGKHNKPLNFGAWLTLQNYTNCI